MSFATTSSDADAAAATAERRRPRRRRLRDEAAGARVSRGFEGRFFAWASAQLDQPQVVAHSASSSSGLLAFLEQWVVPICTADHVVQWWLKAAEVANSWAFVLASLPAAAAATDADERLHERLTSLLSAAQHAPPQRADECTLLCTAVARDVARVGIGAFCAARRRLARTAPSATQDARRWRGRRRSTTRSIRGGAQAARSHPTMHKTKTKEEFALLSEWAQRGESGGWSRFCCATTTSSVSVGASCANWSDRAALLLREAHAAKRCVVETRDAAPLARFVLVPAPRPKHDFVRSCQTNRAQLISAAAKAAAGGGSGGSGGSGGCGGGHGGGGGGGGGEAKAAQRARMLEALLVPLLPCSVGGKQGGEPESAHALW